MLRRHAPFALLLLVCLAAFGYSFTLRVPASKSDGRTAGIFWSDEATYHSMAYSIAFDHDLRYERQDLERVYQAGYGGGPSGLFLVRNPDTGHLEFAKAFAYPAVAAPFVYLFGDNGFFVLHAVLLALMLGCGYAYLVRALSPQMAALWTLTYVLGSVATLYYFWITPEWFNLSLLFVATFLWLYKQGPPGAAVPTGRRFRWLEHGWTDWAAALLYGVAVYSKPPNVFLVAPLLLWTLLRGRTLRALGLAACSVLAMAALFAGTWMSVGSWNYQGGDRRQFNVFTSYPYLDADKGFDAIGMPMTTGVEDLTVLPAAGTLARDLLYIWIGRNGGMLPYMLPAILALGAFLAAAGRRLRSAHGLVAMFWALEILAIVLVVKGNWIGGGGTVGSRYFVNAYAVLFFLLPAGTGLLGVLGCWVTWGLFLSQIVLSPFHASLQPAAHTRRLPYTALPTELTILNNLPFNTNPSARRVPLQQPATFYSYFLDDATWLREPDLGGFWVKGSSTAEIVLRPGQPVDWIDLEVRNRRLPNRVLVVQGGQRLVLSLEPDEVRRIQLHAEEGQPYLGSYLYRLVVGSEASTVPLFDTPGSNDARNLGVFVRPSVRPAIPLHP